MSAQTLSEIQNYSVQNPNIYTGLVEYPYSYNPNVIKGGENEFIGATTEFRLYEPNVSSVSTMHSVAPSFLGDYYFRIHNTPPLLNVGNVSANELRDIRIWNSHLDERTLSSATNNNLHGFDIFGITLPYTFGALEEVLLQLDISTEGPSSIDGNVQFSFLTSADNTKLSVVGNRIISLPYQFQTPMSETIEYKTNHLQSLDASTEDSIKLRQNPRHVYDVTIPLNQGSLNKVKHAIYGWRQRKWALPLWQEVYFQGAIGASDTEIVFNTANYDYRNDSLLMIYEGSNSLIVGIQTVQSDRLVLEREVGQSFTNAYIMPARISTLKVEPNLSENGVSGQLEAKFETINGYADEETNFTQYNGYDVCLKEAFKTGSFNNSSIVNNIEVIDYQVGKNNYETDWQYNKDLSEITFYATGLEEIYEYKKWFNRRAGAYRPFYIPSFNNDLNIISTDNITNSFDIKNEGYSQFSANRNHIAVRTTTGQWLLREVLSVTLDASQVFDTVVIDENLDVDATEIQYISFLNLKRIQNDSVTYQWKSGLNVSFTLKLIDK